MVKIFPPYTEQLIEKGAPDSELKVYELFKALNDNWYVWHSVEWLERKRDGFLNLGESDFLIFMLKQQIGFRTKLSFAFCEAEKKVSPD